MVPFHLDEANSFPILNSGTEASSPQSESESLRNFPSSGTLSWRRLSLGQKMKLFNWWYVLGTVGNFCNIVGAFRFLFNDVQIEARLFNSGD